MNLHEKFPWFFGEAEYTRTFDHKARNDKEQPEPDVLILGSIGSIDQTYLNEIFIQREGIFDAGAVVSAWNKVRVYNLPTGALKPGKNMLRIRVTVLDFKAGMHAGPLKLGHAPELLPAAIGYQYLREYLFFGSPILTMVMILVLLITAKYWQRDEGNHYLIWPRRDICCTACISCPYLSSAITCFFSRCNGLGVSLQLFLRRPIF
jgi:hypothetical protein